MKKTLLAGTCAAAALAVSAVPAQAFSFDNTGINFDVDTTVQFTFLNPLTGPIPTDGDNNNLVDGSFVSANYYSLGIDVFGVYNVTDNAYTTLWSGKIPKGTTASFDFEQGDVYSLFLEPTGYRTVYSTNALNIFNTRASVPGLNVALAGDLFSSIGINMAWEDKASGGDEDYNDYYVNAKAVKEVPTPAAILPVIAGLFGAASKRKEEENV
jgi:hypothetical protein